jgi:hypothetical protein
MAAAAGAGKKKPGKLDPEALAKQEEKAKKVVLLLERNRLTQSIQAEEVRGKRRGARRARVRPRGRRRGPGGGSVRRRNTGRCKWSAIS